jgi:hypothetical protein
MDSYHAGAANLAKLGLAPQGLRRIDEPASEETEIVVHLEVMNTYRSPMAGRFLKIVAKSVGLTLDVRTDSPCWRRNSSGWSAAGPTFRDASQLVDVPALW